MEKEAAARLFRPDRLHAIVNVAEFTGVEPRAFLQWKERGGLFTRKSLKKVKKPVRNLTKKAWRILQNMVFTKK